MTKKDYRLLEGALKNGLRDADPYPHTRDYCTASKTALACALRVSDALAKDNPHFNPVLFLRACGYATRPDGSWEVDRNAI